jgi:thiol-disulfide isomerase/thioredoxin
MHRAVRLAFLAAATLVCVGPLAAQKVFHGKIGNAVHTFPDVLSAANWQKATPAELRSIAEPLSPSDRVLVGVLRFGGGGALQFPAALVEKADGSSALYVDQNLDGSFAASERHVFRRSERSSMYAGSVELELPLKHGPYARMPVVVKLLAPKAPIPPRMHRPDLLVGSEFYVRGEVQAGGHTVVVRLQFDPASGSVDLDDAAEWMNLGGAGAVDDMSGRRFPNGKLPIFHLGSYYLRVSAVDPGAHTLTLESVPASEYKHIDWTRGSVLPNFVWTGLNGQKHRFSDVKGSYRLIDFWATWCGPCVEDIGALRASYEKFHARGFNILSIDGDPTEMYKVRRMVLKDRMVWPQARFDRPLVVTDFGVSEWPTLILVDQKGKVVSASNAALYGDALERMLASLLPPANAGREQKAKERRNH